MCGQHHNCQTIYFPLDLYELTVSVLVILITRESKGNDSRFISILIQFL
jgi:hypothetical protein